MSDLVADLESEYCPPLDSSLLVAILSDYDLKNPEDLKAVRSTLDEIKDAAVIEEATGFDPSGTAEVYDHDRCSESGSGAAHSRSQETDMTSLSNDLSFVDLDATETSRDVFPSEDLEQLDFDTKLALLEDVIGDQVSRYTIKHTLTKCDGKWHNAMEELLNHVYFAVGVNDENERPIANKGVEAFFKDDTDHRSRKTKAKTKRKPFRPIDESLATSISSSHASTNSNIWNSSSEDIEFLASRTRLSTSAVSSTYHANGASIPRTLNALIKACMAESEQIVTDDKAITSAARELAAEFPTIAPPYILTIVRMTHPSTATAHELAQTLTRKPSNQAPRGLQVIPQYTPVDKLITSTPDLDHPSLTVRTDYTSPDLSQPASSRAQHYSLMRATAFAQARAAHRRARSDIHMSGAAAYYADRAREHAALHATASAAAADQLVSRQSSATELDLHGVDVLNAVRIAKVRVRGWWASNAEKRGYGRLGATSRAEGYRIVVGLGKHSEGGKGKLGPAVSKALRAEGWKVEMVGAVVLVLGKEKI